VWMNVARGVLDGAIEHTVAQNLGATVPGQASVVSTTSVMERAAATNTRVISFQASDRVQAIRASDSVRARMLDALADKKILVTPDRTLSLGGRERLAWWQVDPNSGETLGVIDNGLHGAQDAPETAWVMSDGMKLVQSFPGAFPGNAAYAAFADALETGTAQQYAAFLAPQVAAAQAFAEGVAAAAANMEAAAASEAFWSQAALMGLGALVGALITAASALLAVLGR
jgi:hypothetical protein